MLRVRHTAELIGWFNTVLELDYTQPGTYSRLWPHMAMDFLSRQRMTT